MPPSLTQAYLKFKTLTLFYSNSALGIVAEILFETRKKIEAKARAAGNALIKK
jgi:hypothetical protein